MLLLLLLMLLMQIGDRVGVVAVGVLLRGQDLERQIGRLDRLERVHYVAGIG